MQIIKSILFFMLMIGLSGCIIINTNGCNSNNFRAENTYESVKDCADVQDLVCKTCFGKIEVIPATDGQCKVNAKYWVQASSQERADELILTTVIDFAIDGGKINIELKCPDKKQNEGCGADITVSVPSVVATQLHTSHGEIRANGLSGKCIARTSFGDINVNSIGSDLDLNTSHGKIVVVDCKIENMQLVTSFANIEVANCSGIVNAHTSHGKIKVENSDLKDMQLGTSFADIEIFNCSGTVNANTSHGAVKALNLISSKAELRTSFGDIYMRAKDITPDFMGIMHTSHGNIKLENMSAFNGKIDMSTSHGDIKSDLAITMSGRISEENVQGAIGDGNGKLNVRNTFGNIDLKK